MSIAVGLTMSVAVPSGIALAAAVPSDPPNAAVNQPAPRPDVPDAHTMNPSPEAPSNSAPSNSGAGEAPSGPPAADPAPAPPQRKDKPPDRDPHKFSPQKHTTAGSDSSAGDNDNNKGDNDNDNREPAPAPAPGPSTGPGQGAPGPQAGPSDVRHSAMGMFDVWGVAKCVSAITVAIAGIAVPAAKIFKIKQLIKAVGGVGKLVQKIGEAFKLVRKGKSIGAAAREVFSSFGSIIAGIAAEILGIDSIIDNCT